MTKKNALRFRANSRALALEPRLLFDGAGAVAAVHGAADVFDVSERPHPSGDATARESKLATEARPHELMERPGSAGTLIVIDARVPNIQNLLPQLPLDATVRVVQTNESGVSVIGSELAKGRFEAVHILSHGTPGSFALGNDTLSNENLDTYSSALQSWQQHLTRGADILLYGCDVAQGAQGEHFITELARMTQADIAASTNATGNAGQGGAGGDWVLERQTGSIEASVLAISGFDGLLAATDITDSVTVTRVTPEDTSLAITGITITDGDNPASMTLRVQTSGGTSTLTLGGATVSSGALGSADFTISGSMSVVNTAAIHTDIE